ncbi:MAG TPA: 50S ribosomal protein L4 [Clostridia bacterium]|jgi:large subunit ribosomal protein L4|nr:50S ribosomal protein L4 [Clostridiaceae bacterium]HOM33787.1 50S ribosomal protein L4 [Clostridia bacterium]HOT69861.1 50S ribosomal protein L4 [Clostridia bacterium]HQF99553.1 50S ribosomal protein L4 [Clostridia bacterium]HQH64653.1 50S ribosomal protein L4 [Clostridia bacterium]
MLKADVYNIKGEVVDTMSLNEDVFGVEVSESAIHSAVVQYLANARQGTQSTKTRAEVRGGKTKPFRQKGTGRARQGSSVGPHQIGGGVAFAPKPRSYRFSLNKKQKRLALKSALSQKFGSGSFIILDSLKMDEIKTKKFAEILNNIKVDTSCLVVLGEKDDIVVKSARNLPNVATALTNTINVYDIIKYDKFVATKEAVEKIQEVYA